MKKKMVTIKTLKFKHEFVKDILKGKKTTTWRLFDDKDLKNKDGLELIDRDSDESFGKAVIINIQKKKIKDLTEQELKNHGYTSLGDMLDSHRVYYGSKVSLQSEVKIIKFKLL